MNLDEAVKAHSAWKMKLSVYLRHPDHSIDPAEAGNDDHCPLGKWLQGDGKKLSGLPEYKTLVSEHARFHRAVGRVVEQANAGKNVQEESMLGSDSEFADASRNIVQAIVQLKRKTATA
ncbi:MAG: CZB domain-containing protein [Rhodomicrobium sp.]